MTKRIINLLTVLVMTVSLAGVLPAFSVSAETYSGSCGDNVTWSLDMSTGILTISGTGDMYDYIQLGGGEGFTGYSPSWSSFNSDIQQVEIEDGVTCIGKQAFVGCENLKSIKIPSSVTIIYIDGLFYDCESLTEINVDSDNNDYSSQDGVLFNYNKTELIQYPNGKTQTTYIIPNSVTSIWDSAFAHCSSLTNITIPNSVTVIGEGAFYECTSLTSITIPNSVTSIGDDAFLCCDSLTSITIPDSVTSIGDSAFSSCDSLTSVTIPDSVTSIGYEAFAWCESLTSITIPKSVTIIGDDAFFSWDSLTIKCYKDSYAERYAIENDIKYELLDGSKTPNNPNNNQSNKPNNNSTKPNQTVSPTNNKKANPSTNKVTIPKPVKVKSVKLTAKKKKLNVKWKKVSGATGYEVMYAKNNKFTKGKKTVKVKKNKVILKKLKSKNKYFVKVRAYKTVNGNTSYGKWSKVIKKKVK